MPAYLNMSSHAWHRLRQVWRIRPTPAILWQTYGAGRLFAVLDGLQTRVAGPRRDRQSLDGAMIIVGFWRSGTTLLHELLSSDRRFTTPTTYACMNPHHFLLTQDAALSRNRAAVQRPMDDMTIDDASPQEDEFALLSMGARSPYEALMVPQHFKDALALADPADLPHAEQAEWKATFLTFCHGVSAADGGKRLLLKSPPHGYRIETLRQILPDAKFVVLVRNPYEVFESSVRMWSALFDRYGLTPRPEDGEIRNTLLEERMRFENKLQSGLSQLRENNRAIIRYEDLTANPLETIAYLYRTFGLDGFEPVKASLEQNIASRAGYVPRQKQPPEEWRQRIAVRWAELFERYGYTP